MKAFHLQQIHKPLVHYRKISLAAFILLAIAFLLFLLVAISIPLVKTIYLLKINAAQNPNQPATGVASTIKLGVWGFCATSVLDGATQFGQCYGPKLGYTVPADVVSLLKLPSAVVDILLAVVAAVLVLHPIAAGLSFLAFLNSLFLGSHGVSIFALIWSIATALISTIVFVVDLVIVVIAKSKVKGIRGTIGQNITVDWGNAVWMMLVGVIFTWTAVFLLSARACYCCGVSSADVDLDHSRHDHDHD